MLKAGTGVGLWAGGFALCFIIDCWCNFSGCPKRLFSLPFGSDCSLALTQSHCLRAPLVCWGSGLTHSGLSSCFWWLLPWESDLNACSTPCHCLVKGAISVQSVRIGFLHLLPFFPNFLSPLAFCCLFPFTFFCLIPSVTSIFSHFFLSLSPFKHWFSFQYSFIHEKYS